MILHADEPAQATHFDGLDEPRVGVLAHALHTGSLEAVLVFVVELEAVAMALLDVLLAIGRTDV